MTTVGKTSYFNRNDTMLGVCEGIGDELGFSPNWLRIAFAVAFFFYPWQAVLAYLALGAVAALVRKFNPDVVAATADDADAGETDQDLPLAA